ncbi:hypothetical protein CYMTET_29583 [Cymbomonas tetramitiformis]|uniref:Uncharacterized protein n=1 Tax=Cymbomonas tetramitiformis TaxID=36881 RepID=A0AAE0KV06_9CHLO|nr:hypothetical protein CYMTET_29583 [Cymbomonas tetramitiformis]
MTHDDHQGRRRLKKKKKKKKKKNTKKQRGVQPVEKGKGVATSDDQLTPEMTVQTLLKDKAMRDQAFECLPEERQRAITKAADQGEEVR